MTTLSVLHTVRSYRVKPLFTIVFRLPKLLTREVDESTVPITSSVRSSAFQFVARSRSQSGPNKPGPGRAGPVAVSQAQLSAAFVTDRRRREIPSSASKMTARLTNCPWRNDVLSAPRERKRRGITETTGPVRRDWLLSVAIRLPTAIPTTAV